MEEIRFHLDPRCPWCYQTSRWAHRLEQLGEVSIDWAAFSLEIANAEEGTDARAMEARSGPMLRTCIALRERAGSEAVGALYTAFGRRLWEETPPVKVDDLDALRASLSEIGQDPVILDEALADRATWDAVVDEHEAVVARTAAFGVPTIVLDGGEGPAIFGPVIYALPPDDEAVELWRHTLWLTRYGNFAELKRGRGGLPELPAVAWRQSQGR